MTFASSSLYATQLGSLPRTPARQGRVLALLCGSMLVCTSCGDDGTATDQPDASLSETSAPSESGGSSFSEAGAQSDTSSTATSTGNTTSAGLDAGAPASDAGNALLDAAAGDAGLDAQAPDASDTDADASDTGNTDADASDAANTDAGWPDGAVVSPDTNVFRPEEVAPTPQLLEQLEVAQGFELNTFAQGLNKARMLATWGDYVYLTRPEEGDVLRFAAPDGSNSAEPTTVLSDLPFVHGIAFFENSVYLATDTQVLLAAVTEEGNFGEPTVIIDDLPDGGQHPYRTLGIGPDNLLYISVGSTCDACAESNPENATMLRATLDGSARTTYASGLRNTIGFSWHPDTSQLWGMDHGSDNRGDDVPPEELNLISEGGDYGWPYCFGERQTDPVIHEPPDTTKAAYCAQTIAPVLQTQAHNAPIGFVFYTGTAFPEQYHSDAFVALRGSWNRVPPAGYKIARVRFDGSGNPTEFEDFVTGFLADDGASTFARPAGLVVAQDGSLLFTDDSNGVIYRVSYPELP